MSFTLPLWHMWYKIGLIWGTICVSVGRNAWVRYKLHSNLQLMLHKCNEDAFCVLIPANFRNIRIKVEYFIILYSKLTLLYFPLFLMKCSLVSVFTYRQWRIICLWLLLICKLCTVCIISTISFGEGKLFPSQDLNCNWWTNNSGIFWKRQKI